MEQQPKKRGRPRKYESARDRVQAYRQRQREKRRLDGYISSSASWKLNALAKSWNCSPAEVVERLITEAEEKYGDILFPETELDNG